MSPEEAKTCEKEIIMLVNMTCEQFCFWLKGYLEVYSDVKLVGSESDEFKNLFKIYNALKNTSLFKVIDLSNEISNNKFPEPIFYKGTQSQGLIGPGTIK
jgi:hypothetical protein